MVQKVKEKKRAKIFVSVKKHWSETSRDPSASLRMSAGRFFFYLHRIHETGPDGFRPNIPLYFPYGINSLSSYGELPCMHFYFTAIMNEKVEDPCNRKHYLLTLYLPGLDMPFVGGDTFHHGLKGRVFEGFYLEESLKPENKLSGIKGWRMYQDPHIGNGGLILIPDDLELIRGIEASVREVSRDEWKNGPWHLVDVWTETVISYRKQINERRMSPDRRNIKDF